MNLIKIEPEKERARSLLKLSELRYHKIASYNKNTESSLILEAYYEVAKELITAILFIDGYKTLSHEDLITYLNINYKSYFSDFEVNILDQFRKKRNRIVYYGVFVDKDYISRNTIHIEKIISKLKDIINKKL